MNLIKEEFEETEKAFDEEDLVEVADGLADMVWVIMGMCNSAGIDFDKIWQEVKSSNMSKFVDGKFIKNDAGKIMKQILISNQTSKKRWVYNPCRLDSGMFWGEIIL